MEKKKGLGLKMIEFPLSDSIMSYYCILDIAVLPELSI